MLSGTLTLPKISCRVASVPAAAAAAAAAAQERIQNRFGGTLK